jgi:FR47-like protein
MKYPALDLIRMSLELENKIDSNGNLVPLPGMDTTFLAVNQYAQGIAVRYHAQLPDRLRRRLQDLPELVLLEEPARVLAILAEYIHASRFFAGIGCYFERSPAPSEYPRVQLAQGAFCILVNDLAVSRAWTQAKSAQAAELALETLPQYRRLGFGRQVAAAWGHQICSEGKAAFYSYRLDNLASAALARSLGVVRYTRFTSYS